MTLLILMVIICQLEIILYIKIMIDLAIDSRVFINSNLDEALQELDLLFNTENTELIGYPTYGTNFEQFLWSTSPSEQTVKEYVEDAISQNTIYLSQMDYNINVQIVDGEFRSIYYISITVYNGNKSDSRVYEFK